MTFVWITEAARGDMQRQERETAKAVAEYVRTIIVTRVAQVKI